MNKQTFPINKNTNIVQSNFLIEHKQKLSLAATQLLFTIIGMVNKNDEDFKDYIIDYEEFSKLWEIDQNNLHNVYYHLQKAGDELCKKGIVYYEQCSNGKIKRNTVSLLSYYGYELGGKYAIARFDKALKPHLIDLQKQFTKCSLNYIIQLSCNNAGVNTIRTYELLKQYQTCGKRTMALQEYKLALGLIELDKSGNVIKEKYKSNHKELQRKVLDVAKEHINNNTDILIDYELKGRGSNIKIDFTIKSRTSITAVLPEEQTDEELYERECWLEDNFDSKQQILITSIPVDVHENNKAKLDAIYRVAVQNLPNLKYDDEIEVINWIIRFTTAVWNTTKSQKCKYDKYSYFITNLEFWLKNQFSHQYGNQSSKPNFNIDEIKNKAIYDDNYDI